MSIERPMRLVVFGANGTTGRWLVRLAVERGHQVTALMRKGARASVPQGVDVVRGDPLDAAFVDMAVTVKDAVVTALGLRYRRGHNRFSSLVSPPILLSQSAAHTLAAMKRHGVSRISMVSAAGVGDSRKTVAWPLRVVFRISNIQVGYEDHERAEALLAASGRVGQNRCQKMS